MKKYSAENWRDILQRNQLNKFEDIWELNLKQVDVPNKKGKGWSAVSRMVLELPDGTSKIVFLKRQENYKLHSLVFPLFKVMSFEREIKCFLKFLNHGIPIPEPIYFEKKRVGKDTRAVLMIDNLDGYSDLTHWLGWINGRRMTVSQKIKLYTAIADLIRHMHQSGYLHGALFEKHIFIKANEDLSNIDVRLIDLENVRWHPNRVLRDLSRLYMRLFYMVNRHDAMRFLKIYLKEEDMTPQVKETARKIMTRVEKKTQYQKIKNEGKLKHNQ